MSAFLSNDRGTYILKRRYRGVIPIRRASGTHDPTVLERLEAMCDTLYEQGRHDLLESIGLGRLKPLQVWSHFKLGELDKLPHADTLPPLLETFKAWAKQAEGSKEHERSRMKAYRRWLGIAKPGTTVGQLPAILKEDRERMRGKAVSFNNGRAAAMAFVRDILSKRHRLHSEVADVPLLGVTKKRKRRAMTVEQLREAVLKLGHPWGQMAWTMAVTGMGNKEYWHTPWFVYAPTHVEIHGTKRGGRDRMVPFVGLLTEPKCGERTFGKKLSEATGRTTYDLRRTFSVIMANSGIPEARRKVYMGHVKAATMTQWYEMSAETVDYLTEDSERIRAYLGELGPVLQVVKNG